jgi:acetoin utilization deacetylase AcuC-like enzyme
MGDAEYGRVYREIVAPIGQAFAPELVLVSAGFDAYGGDPLASMSLTARGYGELARNCLAIAQSTARGRAVFVLEGGYDLAGLAASGAAVASVLLGDAAPAVEGGAPHLDPLLEAYRRQFAPHWPALTA